MTAIFINFENECIIKLWISTPKYMVLEEMINLLQVNSTVDKAHYD